MPNNQYINKVEYFGQTLIDLTLDTAEPSSVLEGETFHDRSGTPQTGSLIVHNVYDGLDSTSANDALSANQGRVLNSAISKLGTSESTVLQIKETNTKGTLASFLNSFNAMSNDGEIKYWINSNVPSDAPSGNPYGPAIILKTTENTGIAISYNDGFFAYNRIQNGAFLGWKKLVTATDTGWTTINNTYPLYMRVKNEVIYIDMRLGGGATPTDGMVLYTLPAIYRPPHEISVPCHNMKGNLFVKPNGDISVNAVNGQTLNNYMAASLSFPVTN